MFGSLRLILSFLVVLCHLHVRFYGFDEGEVSVISFYILSGYVMTALIRKYYSNFESVPSFYIDRLCRLYPQFLFWLVFTSFLIFYFGYRGFFISNPHLRYLVNSILILPLGFQNLRQFLILPQTWSIGIEEAFYIIIPFIILYKIQKPVFFISFLLYIISSLTKEDYLFSTPYGVGSFTQNLFIFLTGSIIFDSRNKITKPIMVTLSASVILISINELTKFQIRPPCMEICIGYILGVLALIFLSRIRRNKVDDLLGEYSYGVFMCHFPIIFLFEKYRDYLFDPEYSNENLALFLIICFIMSVFSFHFMERPCLKARHHLRRLMLKENIK